MLERIRKLIQDNSDRQSFFAIVARNFPSSSPEYHLIEQAYDTAEREFREKKRDSGELYFEHLRAVALIVLVHMRRRNANTIAATLLHDIQEDIPGWTSELLALKFNREVSQLVWWVTKPPVAEYGGDKEARNRAYHRNLSRAPYEALIIKLADRLHNMLTLWETTEEKRCRKVIETQDFYLPLAEQHILLIHELEDAVNEIVSTWPSC